MFFFVLEKYVINIMWQWDLIVKRSETYLIWTFTSLLLKKEKKIKEAKSQYFEMLLRCTQTFGGKKVIFNVF